MTTTTPARNESATTEPRPAGKLGVPAIVFMVLAGAAPLGAVAASYPVLIAVSQSAVTPLMFLIAGAALLLFSVGFTRMTVFVRDAGAFYSYVQAGLGRIPGVGAATLAIGAYLLLFISIAAYLGVATVALIEHFGGPSTPWLMWTVVWVAFSGLLAFRNIEVSVRFLGVLLVVEILIVVVLDVAILAQGGQAGYSLAPLNPAGLNDGGAALGIMFAFFGYIGFEATAVFRNEARNPDRTIPRATYIAVGLITVLYGVSAYAITIGGGVDQIVASATANPTELVIGLSATYVAPIVADVMRVLLTTSILACLVMFHNVLARYIQTIATKGIAPASLGQIHPKFKAPSRASLTVTLIAIAVLAVLTVIGLDPIAQIYTWLSGAATLGIIALMSLTSLAVFIFFQRSHTARKNVWTTAVAPAVAFFALATVVFLIVQNFTLLTGGEVAAASLLILVVALFVLGIAVALVMRRTRPQVYADLLNTVRT